MPALVGCDIYSILIIPDVVQCQWEAIMKIRLKSASVLKSVSLLVGNCILLGVSAFAADRLDIRGSSSINVDHPEAMIRVSQATTAVARSATEPKIVSVSVPPDSSDLFAWSYDTKIWSTQFPIRDAQHIGIGYVVEPEPFFHKWSPADFVMHDHMYLAPGVPDPRRANITYRFSAPARISEVLIIQHENGIGQIEGFVGNDETDLQSIGRANSTLGADLPLKEKMFEDGYRDVFKFPRSREGRMLRIVITRTPLPNGYALYRAYPRNADHTPYEVLRAD